jgi:hypothetical protein
MLPMRSQGQNRNTVPLRSRSQCETHIRTAEPLYVCHPHTFCEVKEKLETMCDVRSQGDNVILASDAESLDMWKPGHLCEVNK